MESRWLTLQEASEYLKLSRWSLYKLVDRRKVPFTPLIVGSESKPLLRFDTRALDEWMARKMVKPPVV